MSLSSACVRTPKQSTRQLLHLSRRIQHYATRSIDAQPSLESDDVGRQQDRSSTSGSAGKAGSGYRQPEELLTYLHQSLATPQRKKQPDDRGTNTSTTRSTFPNTSKPPEPWGPRHEDQQRSADKDRDELAGFLEQDDLRAAWDFIQRNYATKTFTSNFYREQQHKALMELATRTAKAWLIPLQGVDEPLDVPSPIEALNVLRAADLATPNMHRRVLSTMVDRLVAAVTSNSSLWEIPRAVAVLDEAMILFHQWFHGGWDHQRSKEFDQAPKTFGILTGEQPPLQIGGHRLPDLEEYLEKISPAFKIRFSTNDVPFPIPKMIPETGRTALLLHDILKHSTNQPESFSRYDAFVRDVDKVLANSGFSVTTAHRLMGTLMLPLRRVGMDDQHTKTIVQRILRQTGTPDITLSGPAGSAEEGSIEEDSVEAVCQQQRRKLQRATETENLDWAEKIWNEALPFLQSDSAKASGDPEIMKTFEAFLLSFSTLRRPGHTLDVWNSLVSSGYQPTVKTWTVMLQSCKIGRAYNTLQEIWQRMRRSGIQPDSHAWCARILCLFKCARDRHGFRALEEMGQEWLQAVRRTNTNKMTTQVDKRATKSDKQAPKLVLPPGDIDGVPKPTTVILNAAILGLHLGKHPDKIIRAITWSRQFGIEPNVVTYNTLLSVSLSRGDNAEATAILSRMSSTGISPDSETFTILLNGLFADNALASKPPAEQEAQIFSFIKTVESSGVAVHDKSYTIIIDRLTKSAQNMPLVHKVLSHMKSRGILPSAHVYTVLMTHYFQSTPPDVRAVDELYEQIVARPRYEEVVDTIFYDRMVEGYARIGALGNMMTFLTRMGKEGKRPGWLAMLAVVRSLAEAGEWDRVKMVVADVKHGEGLLRAGLRGTKGQGEFWEFVAGLGLEEGI